MMDPSYTPIPGPRRFPLLGNLNAIETELPARSLESMADKYGPIYRITLYNESQVYISSLELVDEICNEERFAKKLSTSLLEVRNCLHDGVFTAFYPGEENWAIAHRILAPAFGPLSIRGMFDDMYDMASQLVMKWARQGAEPIMVTDDFTRLTLDTIGLCGTGTRFNSFYHDGLHPFVTAMVGMMKGSGDRTASLSFMRDLPSSENRKYWDNIANLRAMAREMIERRRAHPEKDKKDLMNALILGRDPETGQGLSDESIIDNIITFLIAGHETTSSIASFAFYYLLKDPDSYKKTQQEIDSVIGRRKVSAEDLSKLPFTTSVIRETFRLNPAAPDFSVGAHPTKNHEDPVTIGKGRYVIGKDEIISVILRKLHRDPAVYGPDAEEFKPERMSDANFEALPQNAWKPFGNGMRGCIGRTFAWQELLLVMAILLQNFDFEMHDPSYELELKQNLTIKPKDFYMKATLRHGLDPTRLSQSLYISEEAVTGIQQRPVKVNRLQESEAGQPMHVFFGSNTGTCETFARLLAENAARYGFAAMANPLDSVLSSIPRDGPVVVVTPSYEGQPPTNAARFFEWLQGSDGNRCEGVSYAVFGCGHHDWRATFHAVPKTIDQLMAKNGGNRLCEIGLANAANPAIFEAFTEWEESIFWPAVVAKLGSAEPDPSRQAKSPSLPVQLITGIRTSTLGLSLQNGVVLHNRILTSPDVPEKRMVHFKLPEDMTYNCGDYLMVLPVNSATTVRNALQRFGLHTDAAICLDKTSAAYRRPSQIPSETSISISEFFASYVDLSQPISKQGLRVLAEAAGEESDVQAQLQDLIATPASSFCKDGRHEHTSLLDLLIEYPSISLPLNDFISLLPPMRPRQYSISSSPLTTPSEVSITFSVINNRKIKTGHGQKDTERKTHLGVASNYLSNLKIGEHVQLNVRKSHTSFRPPSDPQTPIIMACAGSGLAPFRGFIMERVERMQHARHDQEEQEPAKAILYMGCRTLGKDDICADELENWSRAGAVDVRWAFSRPSHGGSRYIQGRIREDGRELLGLLQRGAHVYICGSLAVASGVRDAFKDIYRGSHKNSNGETGEHEAEEAFVNALQMEGRFSMDIFG